MKKESIIVGIFGLSLGLLVAWGIWNFKGGAPQPEEFAVSPTPVALTTPTPTPSSLTLTLESPKEDYISTESSVLVAGKSKSEATIVVSTNLSDYVLTASQDGSFSQEVDLEEGENVLTVTSYGPASKEETIERSVIYAKES